MKPWAKENGFTRDGALLAEAALPHARRLIVGMNGDLLSAIRILREAHFREFELPRRARAFRNKYLKENE